MTPIKKLLMDTKLKKLRGKADLYLASCDEWEVPHFEQIIQDCDEWIGSTHNFNWVGVMKLANQYWKECNNDIR